MTADKPKYKPHDYAELLARKRTRASDGTLLHTWDGYCWRPVTDRDGERAAYAWLVQTYARTLVRHWVSKRNAQAAYDAAILHLPALPEQTKDVVLPTLTGYLHVSQAGDVERKKPNPELGMRHCIDCEYDPLCPEPTKFLTFLRRILPDAGVRERVQEYAGYTLLGDARFQRAMIFLGRGANGKGVLSNVIQALHGGIVGTDGGKHGVAALSLDTLKDFALETAVGSNLVICDEMPKRGIDEQRLKSLIAGEIVPVNRKNRPVLSLGLTAKWLVLGNHLPAIADNSVGFWRRWDVVPFDVTIPEAERDPLLAETIIHDELPGVLLWALEGLVRLLQRGRFDHVLPAPMKAALASARLIADSVASWVDECDVGSSDECTTTKSQVYEHYVDYAKSGGMSPTSAPRFWLRMKDHFDGLREERPRRNGDRARYCNVQIGKKDGATLKLVPPAAPAQRDAFENPEFEAVFS